MAIERLRSADGQSTDEVSAAGVRLTHSDSIARERAELESFLFDAVYRHERLMEVREAAGNRLRALFDCLVNDPQRLPLRFRRRTNDLAVASVVGEYLAGMTDKFCDEQYEQICRTSGGPLADW